MNVRVMLIVVVVLITAVVAAAIVSGQTGRVDDIFTNSSDEAGESSEDASCQLSCQEDYPSRSGSYYNCLEARGCAG